MADEIKTTPESELEECKTKIIALTYELTRAYADAKQCRLAVQRLPADALFQAATAAMQGILSNDSFMDATTHYAKKIYTTDKAIGDYVRKLIVAESVKTADALLAALTPTTPEQE